MTRQSRDEDFSLTALPREKRSQKIQRYILALTIAAVIAASLVVIAAIAGLAIAPLFERARDVPAEAGSERP